MIVLSPVVLALAMASGLRLGAAPAPDPAGLEFFEKRVRPVLEEKCFRCHGENRQKAGLRLNHISTILKGGESGPAVVPGSPERSRLILAVSYTDAKLQMPPSGKLPGEAIADLSEWVKMGAPWPKEAAPEAGAPRPEGGFDLEARRRSHWCWQPVAAVEPPPVKDPAWASTPVDRFALARLEVEGIRPAADADRTTLARRLWFDITGLPPSPGEAEAFVGDPSPHALESLADRLLASPHFGERWGRHWLDLVRYAETLGHEFDFAIPNAWRYRDYIIRAFNADVPYRDLVREHIAGDLLEHPRRHPQEGFNESALGTGFFWFGQSTHSPVDVRQHQAEIVENQIDVLTKTFLGLTVSCARCHDHKFDAISTRDYYSLYGILESSRYTQRALDLPAREARLRKLAELRGKVREAAAARWRAAAEGFAERLLAYQGTARKVGGATLAKGSDGSLLPSPLEAAAADPPHPLHAWARLASSRAGSIEAGWRTLEREVRERAESARRADEGTVRFADLRGGPGAWSAEGSAFLAPGDLPFDVGDAARPVTAVHGSWAHSGALSRKLEGALRSPTFTIEKTHLHVRAAGRESRLNVVIDNYILITSPIYGGLKRLLDSDRPGWVTVDVTRWKGHRAYLELLDSPSHDLADPFRPGGYSPDGWLEVEEVAFRDGGPPAGEPEAPSPLALLGDEPPCCREDLARLYREALLTAIDAFGSGTLGASPHRAAQAALLSWAISAGLLDGGGEAARAETAALLEELREVEASLPAPTLAPGMTEGDGIDESVFIRGSPANLGPEVPRRFLEALGGASRPAARSGSGRRELAEMVADPANPLLARVMVNRVWHHLFGAGLVPSTDNFGALGEKPSHPELLDWLAGWYATEGGWSTKKLIRLLVTSRVYRMASRTDDPAALERDPQCRLLSRARVRRLEGEAIRDAILDVSGRLDAAMFGPPVPVHLDPFMTGRGRPGASGPLDGAGRRTIYVETRRNFLSPFLLAFDMPIPHSTIGRRTVSNVPAQALILLNDPFVIGEAGGWARRLLARAGASPRERVEAIYRAALGRGPEERELARALDFLAAQRRAYPAPPGGAPAEGGEDPRPWADLCQVVFNLKEFIYIP